MADTCSGENDILFSWTKKCIAEKSLRVKIKAVFARITTTKNVKFLASAQLTMLPQIHKGKHSPPNIIHHNAICHQSAMLDRIR